jgi:hypothetical protein
LILRVSLPKQQELWIGYTLGSLLPRGKVVGRAFSIEYYYNKTFFLLSVVCADIGVRIAEAVVSIQIEETAVRTIIHVTTD